MNIEIVVEDYYRIAASFECGNAGRKLISTYMTQNIVDLMIIASNIFGRTKVNDWFI